MLAGLRSRSAALVQSSSRHGLSEYGAVAANVVRVKAARRAGRGRRRRRRPGPCCRGAFGDEVEVAADAVGGWDEAGGEIDPGPLRELGRRERVPDRAQVLQLALRRSELLAESGQVGVAGAGLGAQPCDQRVLLHLVVVEAAQLAIALVTLGAQLLDPRVFLGWAGLGH
jgi:hypothetical protein